MVDKEPREIPDQSGNQFVSLFELLWSRNRSPGLLATAIEKFGIYYRDSVGRLKLGNEVAKSTALDLLADYYKVTYDIVYGDPMDLRGPSAKWDALKPGGYEDYGWPADVLPNFEHVADKDDDARGDVGPTPVTSLQIRRYFCVKEDTDANEKWWKEKMADAERYGLLKSRVGEGKRGRGRGSLWRPDSIAGWLVDRHAKGREGLPADVARAALKKFPGCEEAAELLFPSDEESPS